MKYFSLLLLFVCCGCFSFKEQLPTNNEIIEMYDSNSLKTSEKTYKIQDQTVISVYDNNKKSNIKFNDNWFVVHSDLLKTMNENQDYIIEVIKKKDRIMDIILYSLIGILIILIIWKIIYVKKESKSN